MSQADWKFLKPVPTGTLIDSTIVAGDKLEEALWKLQGQIDPIKPEIPVILANLKGITVVDMLNDDYVMSAEESKSSVIGVVNTGDGSKTLTLADASTNPRIITVFAYATNPFTFTHADGNYSQQVEVFRPLQYIYVYDSGGGSSLTFLNYVPYDALVTPATALKVTYNKFGLITASAAATGADVGLGNVPNVDCTNAANITSGVISIDRLPAAAVPTLVVVADQTARYALTIAQVQKGDTVKQTDTNTMYYVVDDANLGNAAGYDSYDATVDWSSITSIPTPVSSLTGTNTGDETDVRIGSLINGSGAKTTPVAADMIGLMDSTDSNKLKKLSWTNLLATAKTYFDTLYLEPADVLSTTNQITATAGVGNTTLSIPSTFIAPGSVKATTTMEIGSGTPLNLPNWILQATANVNGYTQLSLQNQNAGNAASSDVVLTSDNGSDTTHFIDVGINSSTYNQAAYNIGGANDGYVFTTGNLSIGTSVTAKDIVFHTGGTTTTNEIGRWKHAVGLQSKLGFIVTTAVNSFTTALGIALTVIPGAAATTTSAGNTTTIKGGPGGSTSGAGGAVSISGGTPVAGAGGAVTVAGSDGVGTNQNGGNLTLQGGARTGTGTAGLITFITSATNRLIIGALGGWTVNSSEGTAKQVLVSQGANATPKWEWPSQNPAEFSTTAATGTLTTGDTILTYATTDLSTTHVTKLAGNQEFQFERAGNYQIIYHNTFKKTSAAGGPSIYKSRVQLSTNGGAYAEITRSQAWTTSPNNALGTSGAHTWTTAKVFHLNIPTINATKDKIRFVVDLDVDGAGTETCDVSNATIIYLGP